MSDEGAGVGSRVLRIGGLLSGAALVIAVINPDSKNTFQLLTGWATFLPRVLPGIAISWGGLARFFLCLILLAGLGHRFCSWLWRESGHPEAWRPRWTLTAVGGIVVMFAAGMAFTGIAHQAAWLMSSPRPRDELGGGNSGQAFIHLLTIANAQETFRYDDSDRNGKPDYWRADVAGLYKFALIELPTALADDRARTDLSAHSKGVALPAAESGYYFRALRFEDEADDRRRPDCYAVCTFPSSLSAGASMFMVSNERIYYGRHFEGKAPEVYPSNPAKDGWIPIER